METVRALAAFHLAMAALHTTLCAIVIYITLTRRFALKRAVNQYVTDIPS